MSELDLQESSQHKACDQCKQNPAYEKQSLVCSHQLCEKCFNDFYASGGSQVLLPQDFICPVCKQKSEINDLYLIDTLNITIEEEVHQQSVQQVGLGWSLVAESQNQKEGIKTQSQDEKEVTQQHNQSLSATPQNQTEDKPNITSQQELNLQMQMQELAKTVDNQKLQITRYEQLIESQNQEIQKSKSSVQTLELEKQEILNQIQQFQEKANQQESINNQQQQNIQYASSQLQQYQILLQQEQHSSQSLQEKYSIVESQLAMLQQQYEYQKKQLESESSAKSNQEKEQELENQLLQQQNEKIQLMVTIQQLQEQVKKDQQQSQMIDFQNQENQNLQFKVRELEAEKASLIQQQQSMSNQLQQYENMIKQQQDQAQQVIFQSQQQASSLQQETQKSQSLQDQNANLQNEIQMLKYQLEQSQNQKQNESLQANNQQIIQDLQTKIFDLENEKIQHNQQIDEIEKIQRSQRQISNEKIEELTRENQDQQVQLQLLNNQISQLEQQIKEYQSQSAKIQQQDNQFSQLEENQQVENQKQKSNWFSSETPLIKQIQPRKALINLKNEFKKNSKFKQAISDLLKQYNAYRTVRGDGNSYFRAVGFAYLEHLCRFTTPESHLESFIRKVKNQTSYYQLRPNENDEDAQRLRQTFLSLLNNLQERKIQKDKFIIQYLEEQIQYNSNNQDEALVWEMRCLTANYLEAHREYYESYCQQLQFQKVIENVLTMGKEADSLTIVPLQIVLKLKIQIETSEEQNQIKSILDVVVSQGICPLIYLVC